MRLILQIISFLGLTALCIASIAYLGGGIDKDLMKQIMLAGTIAWFVTAPLWIGKQT